jgi:Tfp pilus assembly protein PilP
MKRATTILLGVALLVAAGCGQSSEDKAKKQVCNARSDLQLQINDLKNLTLSTVSADGVKSSLSSIKDDLQQIKDAQGNLNADRKSQVQQATQTFESQVKSIVQSVGSSTSGSDAKTQLQSATQQLVASYQQSLAKVDCS